MMKSILILLCLGIVLSFLSSCDESFTPSAPFEPRMVVYSMLSTEKDTQYVRVYSSYNPQDNDPSKNQDEIPVTDAQVTISQQSGPALSFRPITLDRPDKSRYQTDINAYYCYPFRPEKGKTYTLTVSSPTRGTTTASITVPGNGAVGPYNAFVLAAPYGVGEDFGVKATLSPQAKAFLVRIYVDYLSPLPAGGYQPKRFEVPIRRYVVSRIRELYREIYPQPVLRTTPTFAGKDIKSEESSAYTRAAYGGKLGQIYDIEGCGVRFVQAVFYVFQFDEPLWNYYNVANISGDKYSIRTDEPDYTNIKGGFGVFGSVSVDSTVWPLPEKIPPPPAPFTTGCQ